MEAINYFQRFVRKEIVAKNDLTAWLYTRVSSKEQFEKNSSVNNQLVASRKYAAKFNYHITEEFGGTYESAKSDFTRKEFKRLISRVEGTRNRPYAIMVYKMSRFSRSGGNAIGLVNRLVEDLGVHLIEVCSGISTTTERGKVAIYESLFHAYKENLERKELLIPSMIAYMEKGYKAGCTTLGYDHYGPKVRYEQFFQWQQKIVINKDGELLKKAWQWKASGLYSDVQIIQKLGARGLKIRSQRLGRIWRNPFYCGININNLLKKPVKGNWEPLVSVTDFIKVQRLLEGNHSQYQHNKANEDRPLLRLLKCMRCNSHLVGYLVHKKNLHYYRCLKCKGVNLNANTTLKSKRTGAHELFLMLLDEYRIPGDILPIIELQLTRLYDFYYEGQPDDSQLLSQRLQNLEEKNRKLKIRYGLGEIDRETYSFTADYLMEQMQLVNNELDQLPLKPDNLEEFLRESRRKLECFGYLWKFSKLDCKRRLQRTLFPEGIYYDSEICKYNIRRVSEFVNKIDLLEKEPFLQTD